MLLLLFKSRPFVGYLELMIALLPIFFAVVHELKSALATSGKFLSRALYKVLFVAFLTAVGLQVAMLWKSFTNLNSDETVAAFKAKQAQLQNFCAMIPVDEKNSVVCWGDCRVTASFVLAADIKPRCRFFGNLSGYFSKADPTVIDEWLQNVRGDYPAWILYVTLKPEYTGEKMGYFADNFLRQRNPEVEKILAERYSFAGEMKLYGQTMRLYRRKEH